MAARKEEEDGPEVALKLLKSKYVTDKQFVARFMNEAEVASQLRHPNIIRILEIGQDETDVWFTMPRAALSLDLRLADGAMLPEADILKVARDIARALA